MHYVGGYRHKDESMVHLYTECPEGSIIGIARRDPIDLADLSGLERCPWCFEKARREGKMT